ncbi:hypothetical protein B0H65DRAFT_57357 [Neurospora tetraspora]|uniref:Uncharacterized protein n=1 Tax=Neurospora tetraspora TaxID=94610 RepID=A0AAE0JQS1_9PEZI|nr:hypothetical protein B0H65DRAFT_57357 [Neurospora tetraspora]
MKSPTKVARGLSADPQPARVTKAPTPNLVREVLARADNTNTNTVSPELCGFLEGTSAYKCLAGYTCKFNTDLNVVGCCEGDDCLWQTSCCDYNPGPETATWSTFTSECGGLNFDQVGYCGEDTPFCGTRRFENGMTKYYCTADKEILTDYVNFTSAGETTAQLGLPRLTGKNGPAPATISSFSTSGSLIGETVTVRVTETASASASAGSGSSTPSAGVIAGSVVGGAVFGALMTLLAVLLTGYFRKRGHLKGMEPVPTAQPSELRPPSNGRAATPVPGSMPIMAPMPYHPSPLSAPGSPPPPNGPKDNSYVQYYDPALSTTSSPPPPSAISYAPQPLLYNPSIAYGQQPYAQLSHPQLSQPLMGTHEADSCNMSPHPR